MLDPKVRQDLEAGHRKAKFIGLALAASVLIYLLVAYLLSQSQNINNRSDPQILQTLMGVFTFVAIGVGVGLIFIRKALHSPAKAAEAIQKGLPGTIFFSATVVAFALAEAPAVLGLMLFILGGGWGYFLSLSALSIIYFLIAWPKLSSWEKICQEALRGKYQ